MAEAFKNLLNEDSIRKLALAVQSVYGLFQVDEFMESTMDETWDGLELKARGRKITMNLGKYLPADYSEALGVLDQVASCYSGFGFICFPDFVEAFGQGEEDWDLSIAALARYTRHSSSELAVRPFIIKHEERMMAQMAKWSKNESEHIRRLSSEGCRPALPFRPPCYYSSFLPPSLTTAAVITATPWRKRHFLSLMPKRYAYICAKKTLIVHPDILLISFRLCLKLCIFHHFIISLSSKISNYTLSSSMSVG